MEDQSVPLKTYLEKILDERHDFYLRLFDENEKHTQRSLEALKVSHREKHNTKEEAHWSLGSIIALAVALISLILAYKH